MHQRRGVGTVEQGGRDRRLDLHCRVASRQDQADLTGTVKGQAIEFLVSATVQGTPIELKYTGAVDTKDSMKGTLSAGDFGSGTFTGIRKQN